MRAEFKPQSMLRTLAGHRVDFVVIGGMAAMAQGSVLPSFDLDIAYARDRANLARLAEALRELAATLRGAPAGLPLTLDAKTLENGSHFTFDTRYGSLDVLSDPDGAPRYDKLKQAATSAQIEGEPVLVASIDHLIAMKEASGRPKDEYMANELRALADADRRLRDV